MPTNKKPDMEEKWAAAVATAKQYCEISQLNQMAVAGCALDVCEISWGGYHKEAKFTLSRFAEEVGITPKKLSSWVAVRKMVYDKIPDAERAGVSFTKFAQVAANVAPDAPPEFVQEKFRQLINRDGFNSKMIRCLADLRSIAWNFEHKDAAEKISEKTCAEFLFFTGVVARNIKRAHKKLKPHNHGLAHKSNFTNISAARALLVPRGDGEESKRTKAVDADGHAVVITPKDRDIAAFLRKHKGKFFSPTELGMKLKGHNSNSASAWACRTLNKLVAAGCVERNSKGQYRYKEEGGA